MTTLSKINRRKINEEGPMSFRDFMEMSLYYPKMGYYTSCANRIGVAGDYYTSCNLTPLFGEIIAKQIKEMWLHMDAEEFTIVEYGAGTGVLCKDILRFFKNEKHLYSKLNYYIIEKSPAMREREKAVIYEKVNWLNSIDELSTITGCIISNELVDNFAVHQVEMRDELMEIFVDYTDRFTEVLMPASDELNNYLKELNISLPKGFRMEINIEALKWMENIARKLNKGYVLTIDYGYAGSELYKQSRCEGTIVCYNKHTINHDPYCDVGLQDITAHVNFSSLYHWGNKFDLKCTGYTDQANFLLSLGLPDRLLAECSLENTNPLISYKRYQFILRKLVFEMGPKFKVLIQQKGLPRYELSGMTLTAPGCENLFNSPVSLGRSVADVI